MERRKTVTMKSRLLAETDFLVIGGGLPGVAAALALSKLRHKVIVVEQRTYLGHEIMANGRPWIPKVDWQTNFSEVMEACLGGSENASDWVMQKLTNGVIPLFPDVVKRQLEDLLLENNVRLFYGAIPVKFVDEQSCQKVVIAHKGGCFHIVADRVIDATDTGILDRTLGEPLEELSSGFYRTLEFEGVVSLESIPELPPKIPGYIRRVYPGYRGEGHVFVEFGLNDEPFQATFQGRSEREHAARLLTIEVVAYLMNNVASFTNARFCSASFELYADKRFPPNELVGQSQNQVILTTSKRGKWLILNRNCFDGNVWALTKSTECLADHFPKNGGTIAGGRRRLDNDTQIEIQIEASPLEKVDVVVAGGGSSGASAAIACGQMGINTILVDMNPDLGGTGTLGGVDSYWFGRVIGFASKIEQEVETIHALFRHNHHKWNIEAKMLALRKMVSVSNVTVLTNAIVFGTEIGDRRVTGIWLATASGPICLHCSYVIDATGDADVAVLAGAPSIYGSRREKATMWYSLAQFREPNRSKNNFGGMVDLSDISDYTRAIIAGRRRGEDCHDHGIYVAPRESRHIVGLCCVSLTHQLAKNCWPDVINIHYSNHDVKGHSSSLWLKMGLIPPNLEIEIPYRALLPQGLSNVIVVGKAFSTDHDGTPAVRMQADLENLGGVAALATYIANKEGLEYPEVPLPALQKECVDASLLPPSVLDRQLVPFSLNTDQIIKTIAAVPDKFPMYFYSDMEIGEVYKDRIPLVDFALQYDKASSVIAEEILDCSSRRALCLGQLSAMFGQSAGVELIMSEVRKHLQNSELPGVNPRIKHKQYPPDQGAMPDLAFLLYSLAFIRNEHTLALWEEITELLQPIDADFRDQLKGTFYYVELLCVALENLGHPRGIPILRKLRDHDVLRNRVDEKGTDSDYFHERQAFLEITIGRALARCGSKDGVEILISYLTDARAPFRHYALNELQEVTEEHFGLDVAKWISWLMSIKELPAKPICTTLSDEVNVEIMIEAKTEDSA